MEAKFCEPAGRHDREAVRIVREGLSKRLDRPGSTGDDTFDYVIVGSLDDIPVLSVMGRSSETAWVITVQGFDIRDCAWSLLCIILGNLKG